MMDTMSDALDEQIISVVVRTTIVQVRAEAKPDLDVATRIEDCVPPPGQVSAREQIGGGGT